MAFITADRVAETSTTTGTGTFTVAGAVTRYRTFSSVAATSDTFHYSISHTTSNEWEIGLGTLASSTTFTRTVILSSSNANAAVNFTAGTKLVELVEPASRIATSGTGLVLSLTSSQTATAATTNLTAGSYTIPANSLEVGSEYLFEAFIHAGRGATTTATNVIAELLINGSVIRTNTLAISTTASQNRSARIFGRITVRTIGAAGTCLVTLSSLGDTNGTAGAAAITNDPAPTTTFPSTTAIDTTVTRTTELRVRLSAATATVYLHLLQCTISKLK